MREKEIHRERESGNKKTDMALVAHKLMSTRDETKSISQNVKLSNCPRHFELRKIFVLAPNSVMLTPTCL